jgi:membrane-associated protease RseP (regulator of RpoE activity)
LAAKLTTALRKSKDSVLKIQLPRTQKGIYFWFLAFSSFLLFVSLATLLTAAGELSSSSSDLKNLKVVMPNLEEYVSYQAIDFRLNNSTLNTRRLKPSDIPKLADDAIVPVGLDDAINRAFQYFAEFENKRSGPILTVTLPNVQSVEPGSPAEAAGVKSGDLILYVSSAKIESVMGFYQALNEKLSSEITLKLLRNRQNTISVVMKNATRNPLNPSNSGITFSIPPEAGYLTEQDSKKMAEQYRREMLPAISVDWRVEAANNLMQSAKRLNLIAKGVIDPSGSSSAKIQAKDVLNWQHKKVLEAVDAYFSQRRKIENKNAFYLTGMGDAVVGFVCSLVIFIIAGALYWYQRRIASKKS